MTQEEIIKKVVAALGENKIPYMLTGAIAVNYYGRPRLTHDVDLVVQIQSLLFTEANEDDFRSGNVYFFSRGFNRNKIRLV